MPSTRFEIRLNEDDQARLKRIRQKIIDRNEFLALHGISVADVVRHCLMACDPREKS